MQELNKRNFHWLTLATTSTTLVCCALPAAFIALGAGASLASLLSAVPQLVWISQHKLAFFIVAGVMLALGGALRLRPASCPADKRLAEACTKAKTHSGYLYGISVGLYLLGLYAAYGR